MGKAVYAKDGSCDSHSDGMSGLRLQSSLLRRVTRHPATKSRANTAHGMGELESVFLRL